MSSAESEIAQAVESIDRAVCPIITTIKKGQPDLRGSGILITIAGKTFLVSAYHTFERLADQPVYTTWGNDVYRIYGEVKTPLVKNPPLPGVDLGIMELHPEIVIAMSESRTFIDIQQLQVDHQLKIGPQYVTIGYPASKGRARTDKRHFQYTQIQFEATVANLTEYTRQEIDFRSHILYRYPKKDLHGNKYPKEVGLSGGGLFFLSGMDSPPFAPKPLLVGIHQSYYSTHLPYRLHVSLRIDFLTASLRKMYPALASAIPYSQTVRG